MKEVAPNIDFADSRYCYCETKDNNLYIYLNSWDDRIIKIIFFNAIQFFYREGDITSGVFERTTETPFLSEALASHYEKIPEDHPFKVFIIRDIQDFEFVQVVAEGASVSKYDKEEL